MPDIIEEIMKLIPDPKKISDSCFEGANIILYTKDSKFFLDNNGVIKNIVDNIKKRVELRPDPSITMDQEKAEKIIKELIPEDAKVDEIIFDAQRSRVIIGAEKPGVAIGKMGEILKEIRKKCLWVPIIRRTPALKSKIIENIRAVLYQNSDFRRKFLDSVGHRIYDGWKRDKKHEWVRITYLGGARQVGRSCFLLQTPNSKVLLDCGFDVAAPRDQAFPYLDAPEFNIQDLDAVIISHPHIDHCLPPDTLVELENGVLKPIDDIQEGDNVLTINWKTGKKEINHCLERIRTYTHKEIINIKTTYHNIEASPNHKFFVINNGEVKELEAKDLRKGMIIPAYSSNINLEKNIDLITENINSVNDYETTMQIVDENKLRLFLNSDVTYHKITSIEKYPNKYKYLIDIKVSDNSNFVANGIVVHNCGTAPYLYKMGYRGPVYCTAPTRDVAALLCLDMAEIAMKEGNEPLYSSTDIKEMVKHTICLDYEEVSDITSDIRITFYNAGHNLGSSLVHMHIGNGLTNFLYSGDFNYETSNLLGAAATKFPRLETVMMESTYGTRADTTPTRKESEDELIGIIKEVSEREGKILMPVLGVGRSQEVMLILERAMREGKIQKMPIYVHGSVWDVTAIHTAYPDFFNAKVKKEIFQKDRNPFLSEIFQRVRSQKEMQEVKDSKGPFIVLATSGMLQGGPSLEYFKHFAEQKKNAMVMTCYQGVGSIGRRIEEGDKEISFSTGGSKKPEIIKVIMDVYSLKGFSGHSSWKQLNAWVGHLEPRPKKVIVIHGDYSRCIELASSIYQQYRIETVAPKNLETIRLR